MKSLTKAIYFLPYLLIASIVVILLTAVLAYVVPNVEDIRSFVEMLSK